LDQEEGAKGVLAGSKVSKTLNAGTDDEGHVDSKRSRRSKDLPEVETMITWAGLIEHSVALSSPRASSCINNDTSNGIAMPKVVERRGRGLRVEGR